MNNNEDLNKLHETDPYQFHKIENKSQSKDLTEVLLSNDEGEIDQLDTSTYSIFRITRNTIEKARYSDVMLVKGNDKYLLHLEITGKGDNIFSADKESKNYTIWGLTGQQDQIIDISTLTGGPEDHTTLKDWTDRKWNYIIQYLETKNMELKGQVRVEISKE